MTPSKILFTLVLLMPPRASPAQEGASFLKVGAGARALGMGGAYTALAEGADAIAWNPGGLARLSRSELDAMHARLATDASFDFLSYAQPTRYGALGAGLIRLSQGDIEGRDASGRPSGGFSSSDQAFLLSYASGWSPRLQLGGDVKFIQSDIAGVSARTFAADFGAMCALPRLGPGIARLGLAAQNIGPGLRYLDARSELPLTVAAGASYALPTGWILAFDVKHRPRSGADEFSVGTEYAVLSAAPGGIMRQGPRERSYSLRAASLRLGYGASAAALSDGGASRALNGLRGLGAGVGIKFSRLSLDYAVEPMGGLGTTQEISLGMKF